MFAVAGLRMLQMLWTRLCAAADFEKNSCK